MDSLVFLAAIKASSHVLYPLVFAPGFPLTVLTGAKTVPQKTRAGRDAVPRQLFI